MSEEITNKQLAEKIDGLVTKDDLAEKIDGLRNEMATKDDLQKLRSEMVTKSDLDELRTDMKSDLSREITDLADNMQKGFKRIEKLTQGVGDVEQKVQFDFEPRIETLENDMKEVKNALAINS